MIDADEFVEIGRRPSIVAEQRENDAAFEKGELVCDRRPHADHLREIGDCLWMATLRFESHATAEDGVDGCRSKPDRRVEIRNGMRVVAQAEIGEATSVEVVGRGGPQRQSAVEVRNCGSVVLLVLPNMPATVKCRGEVGLRADGTREVRKGRLEISVPGMSVTAVL